MTHHLPSRLVSRNASPSGQSSCSRLPVTPSGDHQRCRTGHGPAQPSTSRGAAAVDREPVRRCGQPIGCGEPDRPALGVDQLRRQRLRGHGGRRRRGQPAGPGGGRLGSGRGRRRTGGPGGGAGGWWAGAGWEPVVGARPGSRVRGDSRVRRTPSSGTPRPDQPDRDSPERPGRRRRRPGRSGGARPVATRPERSGRCRRAADIAASRSNSGGAGCAAGDGSWSAPVSGSRATPARQPVADPGVSAVVDRRVRRRPPARPPTAPAAPARPGPGPRSAPR